MEFLQDAAEDKSARYRRISRIGEGTFGDVSLAMDTFTGAEVAVKTVRIIQRERVGIPRAVFRELEALRELQSCKGHVVDLLDFYPDETNLCLVFEFLPTTLADIIENTEQYLPAQHFKAFAWMLFDALSYCHGLHIIHRDIKPQISLHQTLVRLHIPTSPVMLYPDSTDLLISSTGQLKLGDFGLARAFDPTSLKSLSHQVSTRWYRAPELLFASRHYSLAVDVWSAAAVLAELLSLIPLFPGNNDIDQIYRVFQIMGSPSTITWPGVEDLPDFKKICFSDLPKVDLKFVIPHASNADLAFLRTILVMDPAQRATAQEARDCSYLITDLPIRSSIVELAHVADHCRQSKKKGGKNSSSIVGSNAEVETAVDTLPQKNENIHDYLQRFVK